MSGTIQRPEQERYVVGITRRLFALFVALSFVFMFMINSTDEATLKLLMAKFPELSQSIKTTFIHTYKMGMSLGLFLADIIIVGPFAYLSYFASHIRPRAGHFVNSISFFDLGILAATLFTIAAGCAHFVIMNSVSPTRISLDVNSIYLFNLLAVLVWIVLILLKVYSYTREQRKELKKYAIRF